MRPEWEEGMGKKKKAIELRIELRGERRYEGELRRSKDPFSFLSMLCGAVRVGWLAPGSSFDPQTAHHIIESSSIIRAAPSIRSRLLVTEFMCMYIHSSYLLTSHFCSVFRCFWTDSSTACKISPYRARRVGNLHGYTYATTFIATSRVIGHNAVVC